ncbi:MAG: GldM family protein [Bacteroidota bacterium]
MQSRGIILVLIVAFLLGVQNIYAQNYAETRSLAWALVGGKQGGNFNKRVLEVQKGIGAMQQVSPSQAEHIKVDSFSVLIIRNDRSIYNFRNKGAYFERNVHDMLEKLQIDDKVLFSDIYATDLNKKIILLSPLEFLVK